MASYNNSCVILTPCYFWLTQMQQKYAAKFILCFAFGSSCVEFRVAHAAVITGQ